MFRERPLTWLFVVATVAVDVVLLIAKSEGFLVSALRTGFVLGQLAALAIWTVRGQLHRLTRLSCLVIATGGLTYVIDTRPESNPTWLAFNAGYAFFVVLAAAGTIFFRVRMPKQSQTEVSDNRWQVPLIEFFGLTIVVAIISFGVRSMDFGFLQQRPILFVVALTAVPMVMAVFVRRNLRDLGGLKAVLFTAVIIASATYLGRIEAGGECLVFAQAAYLALGMAVLGMDDVLAHVKSVGNTSLENEAISPPGLFNPQD